MPVEVGGNKELLSGFFKKFSELFLVSSKVFTPLVPFVGILAIIPNLPVPLLSILASELFDESPPISPDLGCSCWTSSMTENVALIGAYFKIGNAIGERMQYLRNEKFTDYIYLRNRITW